MEYVVLKLDRNYISFVIEVSSICYIAFCFFFNLSGVNITTDEEWEINKEDFFLFRPS